MHRGTKLLALLVALPLWLAGCGGGGDPVAIAVPPPAPSADSTPAMSPATASAGATASASGATTAAGPATAPATGSTSTPPPAAAQPWTGPIQVGTTSVLQSGPGLARLAAGQTAVAWPTSAAGTQEILVQRYDDNGAAVGAAVRIDAAATPTAPTTPGINARLQDAAIAATADGYVVSWCAFHDRGADEAGRPLPGWDGFLRRFASDGTPLGAVLQVTDEPWHQCPLPHVAPLADGGLGVAYWAYRYLFVPGFFPGHCVVRTFDAAGTASAATSLGDANACTASRLADGGFAVALERPHYISNVGLFLRRFDARGAQVGSEVFIDGTPGNVFGDTPSAVEPDLATTDDGRLLLAWVNGSGVVVQAFTAEGVPAGNRLLVSERGHHPAVAPTRGGGVALAWLDVSPGNDDLWTRSFAADGTPADTPLQVASFVHDDQLPHGHAVAPGGSGGFVLGWQTPAASAGGLFDVWIAPH